MIKRHIVSTFFTIMIVGKSVFINCGGVSELSKLINLSKEIQVQITAMEPEENIVELRLP